MTRAGTDRRLIVVKQRALSAVIAAALVVVVVGLYVSVRRAVPPEGRIAAVAVWLSR
jgi:hypothetical protein